MKDNLSPEIHAGDQVEAVPWKDGPGGRSQSLDFDKAEADPVDSLSRAELDKWACRAAGIEPDEEWYQQTQYQDRPSSGWYRCGGIPAVSTDPAALSREKAALGKAGLLWGVERRPDGQFYGWVTDLEGENLGEGDGDTEEAAFTRAAVSWGLAAGRIELPGASPPLSVPDLPEAGA